ncbi:PTS sugar transporter subunit IIA [Polynucleobacter sphagniphilus]|jgi:PTS system nitrogen regulatory IIA component|uniref:PTS system nitrogen regulatory IIA component n=1 Tax=Polynucleobacter sphagniphilus TaxID=1743169 RepID=A0AA43M751_9BURK|nr:PTS sugar transporter subunit IIA [Polynucleobacter sphagniphilus]MDF9788582.1 PTS system nitrogen regulatory IIA component [Polynucleobacter sphagniphilus]MDH6155161.1 PTS system nitrogen regulatory IIA component [Polynucleobacter sphagniphilus]MDH6241749.1 PTS system nitrogen regulatory IIA component [Polynucleobacter sphagniphilus]MDH6248818.1 PTS system nitrogen regulatory IIA component [Polynucleobacter sphagniphilus]MDH6299673.1 PTS system nitrogen regulatory IIA component [Polynucleo
MNALTDLFTLDRIALDNPAKSRADAFAAAGNLFAKEGSIDAAAVVGFLNAREDLGSTALGAGVAIPHGRVKGLKHPVAAFIKLAQAIEFAAPDGEPVSVLIFLLVPEKATQQHLEILSSIAQLLSDPGARNTLASEKERTKVYELLQQWSPSK